MRESRIDPFLSVWRQHALAHSLSVNADGIMPGMVDDPDIWRAASLLVKRHGHDAALVAARRADELLAVGDPEGCVIWKQILEAVAELTRMTPADGERVKLGSARAGAFIAHRSRRHDAPHSISDILS